MKSSARHPRDRRGGLLTKLLLFLAVIFVVAAIVWTTLLPGIAVAVIRSRTGFAVQLRDLSVNPFTAQMELHGLVLENPEGWPAREFVNLRQFKVDAHLFSLFSSRFVADEIVVDVAQVSLVKNQQGLLNASAFKDDLLGREKAEAKDGPKQEFYIKHLVLKFDKLVSADYSGKKPSVKEYNLNISRDLADVDSVTKIISPFAGAALGLVTDTLGGMFKGRADSLKTATEALKGATGTLQDAGKKTGEVLKGLISPLDKKKP